MLHRERERVKEHTVREEREREKEVCVLKMVALFFYFGCSLFA